MEKKVITMEESTKAADIPKGKGKSSRKKKAIIISIVTVLLLLFVVAPICVSLYLYNQFCGVRYETYKPLSYSLSDFPGLKRDRYEFLSDKGQKLVGYKYYHTDEDIKGLIVFAHGFGGGGHNSYMNCADYFTKNGYYVFAFDATGNDESSGDSVEGLPQIVADLDNALSFVEQKQEFKNLPVMLFGHSWGGYAVTSVLNFHPEVKGVVSLSGFNKSSDMISSQGEQMVGDGVKFLLPYINLVETVKFGKYASASAMDGFANSETKAFIVHSRDDDTVDIKYGYDIYYQKYKNSSGFTFVEYENKGHNSYYSDEAEKYIDSFNKQFEQHFGTFDVSPNEKEEYINKNLDRKVWNDLLDKKLFKDIVLFYDSCI